MSRTIPRERTAHVTVDGRRFIVEFKPDGSTHAIKERKQSAPPRGGVYDVGYWLCTSHPPIRAEWSLAHRIVQAARAKIESRAGQGVRG